MKNQSPQLPKYPSATDKSSVAAQFALTNTNTHGHSGAGMDGGQIQYNSLLNKPTAGVGISISAANVIANTLPDQTVVLTNGTAIAVTGTYPNFTITNTSPGGTPGGSNTQVQYNNSGAFGGSSNFTFDGTIVSVNGKLKIPVGTNLY